MSRTPLPNPPPQGGREQTFGSPARRRLAGFSRTLRDNGFKIGLAETQDALALLGSPAAMRASSLKPAFRSLFCATHSDWERFDAIFEAYWRGGGMRQRQVLSGAPSASHAPARRLAEARVPQEALGLPDRVERRSDGDGESPPDGRGRREGASRAESLSASDLRHIVDPDESRRRTRWRRGLPAPCGRGLFAASRFAATAAASTCAAPSIATSRMAER